MKPKTSRERTALFRKRQKEKDGYDYEKEKEKTKKRMQEIRDFCLDKEKRYKKK